MNRIDRLSAILIMLQSFSSVKPTQITQRFGIGMRTVYRDIRSLEEAGIPITGDSRSGYSLVEGYKLPPLMFTQKEAFAFLATEKIVDKFMDAGLQEGYKSGMDKIKAVMTCSEQETMEHIDKNIGNLDFHSPALYSSQDRLQLILDCILKKRKLIVEYHSHSKNEETHRTVDPVGVFFSMANWYLIAFCNTRNDYRTFKVSRIVTLRQSDIPIDRGHPPLAQFLKSLEEKTELQEAVIKVNADSLSVIDESKYYQGLISEIRQEDWAELHFMTFSLDRLARWSLSYIDIAVIVSPGELQYKVNEILSKRKR